jgi:hypothetical protein
MYPLVLDVEISKLTMWILSYFERDMLTRTDNPYRAYEKAVYVESVL